MTTVLLNHGDHICIDNVNDSSRLDHVPPHVYTLQLTPVGIRLDKDRAKFDVPPKLYGKHERYKDIIVQDFLSNRESSTGAIFYGLKGAGKSILAELIGNNLLARDIPVIMITEPLPGELIRDMARLCAPCMFYFDEFGKTYSDAEKRQKLLPLFSDTSLKQVLFVITGNEKEEFNEYMIDRPSRFRYCIGFDRTDEAVVKEMISDVEIPREIALYLRRYAMCTKCSYDVLKHTLQVAAKCKTVNEFRDMLEIMNVASPVYDSFHVNNAMLDGQPFHGRIRFSLNKTGSRIRARLFNKVDLDPIHDVEILLEKARKTQIGGTDIEPEYRVQVDDRLSLDIKIDTTTACADLRDKRPEPPVEVEETKAESAGEGREKETRPAKEFDMAGMLRNITLSSTKPGAKARDARVDGSDAAYADDLEQHPIKGSLPPSLRNVLDMVGGNGASVGRADLEQGSDAQN